MKKIILSLVALLAFSTTYAQTPTLTFSSVTVTPKGGESETFNSTGEFLALIDPDGDGFRELEGGTEYLFTFDYTNQADDNFAIVKILNPGYGGLQEAVSETISGDGTTTVSLTPNAASVGQGETGILQYRTQFTDFGAAENDNSYLFQTSVTEGSLSTKSFSKAKLEISYNAESEVVTLPVSLGYSVYTITGATVAEGEGTEVSLAGLPSGIYILATDNGTAKIAKN